MLGGRHNKKTVVWRDDPNYDSGSDSIPTWSNDDSESSREIRSGKVLEWTCGSSGWWGKRGECMAEEELAGWLLYAEGGAVPPNGRDIIARIIRSQLSAGISAKTLSFYTSWFNPKYGNNGRFGQEDWTLIKTPPPEYIMKEIQDVYKIPGDPLIYDGGKAVYFWWRESEDTTADPTQVDAYYKTQVISNFVQDPYTGKFNPVFEWFYIGTCSQAIAAGFKSTC